MTRRNFFLSCHEPHQSILTKVIQMQFYKPFAYKSIKSVLLYACAIQFNDVNVSVFTAILRKFCTMQQ